MRDPRLLATSPRTSLIAWLETMTRVFSIPKLRTLDSVARASEGTLPHAILEIMHARLALLADLEASLHASQRALLSRDISSLEKHTSEQVRLQTALAIVSSPSHLPSSYPTSRPQAVEVHAAELRVLHHGRVQAAMLDRAQRWQRTVANLLAGVEKNYAPPSGVTEPRIQHGLHLQPALPLREAKERDSCRA